MDDPIRFSASLRRRSSSAHSSSEGAGFMSDLMTGAGTRADYTALVVQHWYMYEALERAADAMRDDPVASAFISDDLVRLPALASDLELLLGPEWRSQIAPLPATAQYASRIQQVGGEWPGGFVAHHYTRYLGDLSGGQHIGRLMARHFGFDGAGVEFYGFAGIPDPMAFKEEYRERLDAAPWDADEQERVIEEVLLAYRMNTEVFADLATAKAAAPAA